MRQTWILIVFHTDSYRREQFREYAYTKEDAIRQHKEKHPMDLVVHIYKYIEEEDGSLSTQE